MWTHRILLESFMHASSVFVTLTYDDQHIPADGGLVPGDLQLWLKRIRRHFGDKRLRFFGCGEYGGERGRPHYHLALFGMPQCAQGSTRYNIKGEVECCYVCSAVASTWGCGRIQVAPLEGKTAAYVAGYVSKKSGKKHWAVEAGLTPEFQRMSLKPGIGAAAMAAVSSALMQSGSEDIEDVPHNLRHGKFLMPLGRYLRKKLREEMGRDASTPQSVLDKAAEEMLPLLLAARSSSENPSLRSQIFLEGMQARLNLEARLIRQGKLT